MLHAVQSLALIKGSPHGGTYAQQNFLYRVVPAHQLNHLLWGPQTMLEGFNNMNPFKLIFSNDIHQAMEGNQEHLLNLIEPLLSKGNVRLVNEAVLSCPIFSGLRLPSQVLFTSRSFATQPGGLVQGHACGAAGFRVRARRGASNCHVRYVSLDIACRVVST